jgi:hypothetical protein
MNITLLQFETEEDAGDEGGKDFVGLHRFGIWIDEPWVEMSNTMDGAKR